MKTSLLLCLCGAGSIAAVGLVEAALWLLICYMAAQGVNKWMSSHD